MGVGLMNACRHKAPERGPATMGRAFSSSRNAMNDLVSAMAAIAFIAVVLVTLLFNVERLQGLSSKDEPPAVQIAQSQIIPVPVPDPISTRSK